MLVAPPPPPAMTTPIRICDVECYRNYFLVKFYDIESKQFFSITFNAWTPLNTHALLMLLKYATIVTFNGNKYDMLMISAACTGRFTNDMLKNLSDYIITTKPSPQPWMIARDWGFDILELDHIDLIEIAPGDGSLKIYGGRLHCKKMQDLPLPPSAILTPEQMIDIDTYCGNDLITTADLYLAVKDDIDTRIELTAQYGMDMRSKSDAQIAEAAFKKLLGLDYRKSKEMTQSAQLLPGTICKYRGAPFLQFKTQEMLEAYTRVLGADFVISDKGIPLEPKELDKYKFSLGAATYSMGIGGLHSTEKSAMHISGPDTVITDFDVASYYPKIISILRLYPKQIGPVFLEIYDGWITVRLEYKGKGQKKKAATFKIKLNGTFGKTNSKYSILFSPDMFIQIVLTGQFSVLMLIDMMHLAGIEAISANTDGVVFKCHPSQVPTRDAIVKHWETITGFEMEANIYQALLSRDINNYLAAKPEYTDSKGVFHPFEWKAKGAYADPGLAKNPTNIICVDAVKAYLQLGTPLEQTIRRCDDIRKFVTVRGVQGGGEWVHETVEALTVGDKRAALIRAGWVGEGKGKLERWGDSIRNGITLDEALRAARGDIPRTYLGKAVRWYYGAGQRGHIAYASNGNLVARSEGAKPCMELPDVLPPDIDYTWYITEAQSLLRDLGVA